MTGSWGFEPVGRKGVVVDAEECGGPCRQGSRWRNLTD